MAAAVKGLSIMGIPAASNTPKLLLVVPDAL
jgi:hypothetical protein